MKMKLYGRFYTNVKDLLDENENYNVCMPFSNDCLVKEIVPEEYNGKYMLKIVKYDEINEYARPFVCVMETFPWHGGDDAIIFKIRAYRYYKEQNEFVDIDANRIESFAVPANKYFPNAISIYFKEGTQYLASKIEIVK